MPALDASPRVHGTVDPRFAIGREAELAQTRARGAGHRASSRAPPLVASILANLTKSS